MSRDTILSGNDRVRLLIIPLLALLLCSWIRADEDAAPIRKIITDALAAGKKPFVFAPVFGKESKVQLSAADDKGLTVVFLGNNLPLAWKDLNAAHLGAIASECASTAKEHVEIAKFYAAKGLGDRAEKAGAAALALDKSVAGDLAEAMKKIKPAEPSPTPAVAAEKSADEKAEKQEKPKSLAERMGMASGAGAAQRTTHDGRVLPPMPPIKAPIMWDTPEADAILSAMQICPKNSPWHEDISKLPVHPDSDKIVANIGANKNIIAYGGQNFILVPPDQPRVPVKVRSYPGEADKGPFPVPDLPPIEGWSAILRDNKPNPKKLDDILRAPVDGDRHVIVVDPVRNMSYDFFATRKTDSGWEAGSIAVWNFNTNKVKGSGACNASGLPYLPTIVRYDELQRGNIDHALVFTVSKTRKAFIWPAKAHAGHTDDPHFPAFGQRFRLKANVDISKLPKDTQTICIALKKYGMMIMDNGPDWDIYVSGDHRVSLDNCIRPLRQLKGSDFEVVLTTGEFEGPRTNDPR